MDRTIENIIYIVSTPDPHVAANCPCQKEGPYIFYLNEVLVREKIRREGKISFSCKKCNAPYEIISEKQVYKAKVKQPIENATY